MDRAVVIAFAVLGVALAGVIGLGIGFLYISGDPMLQVQRRCSSGQLGPPGGCRNLKITAHTSSRVEFTYDLANGGHCTGYQEIHRGGPFGLAGGGGGGEGCGAPGQPAPGIGMAPPRPTPFPDGNLPCSFGQVTLTVPPPTATGFAIQVTNKSAAACDLQGPAKVIFLDSNNRSLAVDLQPAAESGGAIALAPGGTAAFTFDNGFARCQTVTSVILAGGVGGPPMATPGLRACSPVITHQPVLLSQPTG